MFFANAPALLVLFVINVILLALPPQQRVERRRRDQVRNNWSYLACAIMSVLVMGIAQPQVVLEDGSLLSLTWFFLGLAALMVLIVVYAAFGPGATSIRKDSEE